MKTIIYIVIAGVVLLGLWYFFGTDASQNTAPEGTATSQTDDSSLSDSAETALPTSASVTYTDNGFSPATVTIALGGTVMFVNQSSGTMWVASASHPTHTDYPEFDERQEVDAGGIYSFTFTKAGTWKYHNHRDPSDRGTVIVN